MAPGGGSGGRPYKGVPHNDIGEHKLTIASKNADLPKWTFGTASRFGRSPRSTKDRSTSCPSSRYQSVATFAIAELDTVAEDFSTAGASEVDDGGADGSGFGGRSEALAKTWSVGGGVPRLDGSVDRFIEPRSSMPKPKQYDPAVMMGADTSLAYETAPQFSFGGGKLRGANLDRRLVPSVPSSLSPGLKKSQSEPSPQQQLEQFRAAKAKKLSRGFGTEVRLRYRGGALQLPPSPGPAAYELQRDGDLLPQWAPSSTIPWGKRTSERPSLKFPTASDVAPGEYTAHHQMQAARPSPVFGHPLRELTKDNFPEPGRYSIPTTVGVAPKWSMGTGSRPALARIPKDQPGPGHYDPDVTAVDPQPHLGVIDRQERAHPTEDVDPDEPPGPGSYWVRTDPTGGKYGPSAGLPKDEKLKKFPGMGGDGPGPGHVPSMLSKQSAPMSFPLPRKLEATPGPTEYNPQHSLTEESPPQWMSPQRSAIRKAPWEQLGAGEEESGDTVIRPLQVRRDGPKWTMRCRRPLPFGAGGAPHPNQNYHSMVGPYCSLTPRRATQSTPNLASIGEGARQTA